MFKLTVEQILASVEALNADERLDLQKRLPSVLGKPTVADAPSNGQSQSQNLGNVTIGGSSSVADFSQKLAGGNISSYQKTSYNSSQVADLKEALSLLAEIKQRISTSAEIKALQDSLCWFCWT